MNKNIDYIVVGLGNVGKQYEMTRHNMGFMVLDFIAEKNGFNFKKIKFKSLISEIRIFDKKVLFMKPSTFMNNSGEAVIEAMNFYKLNMDKIIVIYDDISLDLGNIRIRKKGSDGGHNGIKNIIYLTRTDVFSRIRVGVSGKPHPDYVLTDWVLSRFKIEEKDALNRSLRLSYKGLELIIKDSIDLAMNMYN